MYYLNQADRATYNAFTTWVPRPLSKSEKVIAKISDTFNKSVDLGEVGQASAVELTALTNSHITLADEIQNTFGHMYERRNLALRALTNAEAMKELLALYPNVAATEMHKNRPTKGLLGLALSATPNEAVAAAQQWFDVMVGALSLCPKLKDYFLVYSGVGPTKAIIHRVAIEQQAASESKSSLLYGVAVNAVAQKTFIELFNVRNHGSLRLILQYELHLDPTFTKGAELEINKRVLPEPLHNHNVLDFNYRGHKATFFTKM